MLEFNVNEFSYPTIAGPAHVALRDISFSIGVGERVCLFGPSGCGKSTILRIILGLENRFEGQLTHVEKHERIAAVFQEPRLLPWITVENNIRLTLPLALRDIDLTKLYSTLGLIDHLDFYPGELSLGLARRVALARALAIKPSLLVLDEAFVSLDKATAKQLRRLLLRQHEDLPIATLYVTHDLSEAMEMAERIIVLNGKPGTNAGEFNITIPSIDRTPSVIAQLLRDFRREFDQG